MAVTVDGTTGVTAPTLSATGNVSAAGNIIGGNIIGTIAAGANSITTTGNITGGNVLGGANVNATTHTGTTVSVTGNITGGNVLGGANVNATTHTGTTVSVSGNVTAANVIVNGTAAAGSAVLIVSGNIQTTTANATSNIGNTSNYFNTVHAKATTALYADVAELYTADAPYGPGTVLIFGGSQEVTATTTSHSSAVAGVVSQNPSHLMNAGLKSTHVVALALLGRVFCNVRGNIQKGDLLVSSDTAGVAEPLDPTKYQPGCVIGKSLENYNSDTVGRIEIAVGVK